MARDYWISFSTSVANSDENDPDDDKWGFGSRLTTKNLTDEVIDMRVEQWAGSMRDALKRIREKEAERDRELAKPFWMKWVGA